MHTILVLYGFRTPLRYIVISSITSMVGSMQYIAIIPYIYECKRSMFSLSNIGMSFPGLNTNSKVHLYKTICQPTLSVCDCLSLTKRNIEDVQATHNRTKNAIVYDT